MELFIYYTDGSFDSFENVKNVFLIDDIYNIFSINCTVHIEKSKVDFIEVY